MSNPKPSIWEVFKSVLASFFGVQNEEIRQRDFTYGEPGQFIVIGIILTVALIAILFLIVDVILYFVV
jgi:hypothetical protein